MVIELSDENVLPLLKFFFEILTKFLLFFLVRFYLARLKISLKIQGLYNQHILCDFLENDNIFSFLLQLSLELNILFLNYFVP